MPRTRAERRALTERIIARRLPFCVWIWGESIPAWARGRCKRHHPHDCHNPRCFVCHSDKILGEIAARDARRMLPDE